MQREYWIAHKLDAGEFLKMYIRSGYVSPLLARGGFEHTTVGSYSPFNPVARVLLLEFLRAAVASC